MHLPIPWLAPVTRAIFLLSMLSKFRLQVVVNDCHEIVDDGGPLQSCHQSAVDVNRCLRFFTGAGQRDSDMSMLRFSWAVNHASHDGNLQIFDAWIHPAPDRHF